MRSLPSAPSGLNRWLNRWLFKVGEPEPGEVLLTQRRVFILPSKAGLGFAVLLVVMFIGSINYNLSLGFGLTFLIAACAVVDMHLSFRNLAYLHLLPGRALPVFAGEDAQFELQLANRRRYDRFAIWIGFIDAGGAFSENQKEGLAQKLPARPVMPVQAVDIGAQATTQVTLGLPTRQRGWVAAPRVRLYTHFPLGLLRAWSYWHPQLRVLVYPMPEANAPPLPVTGSFKTDGSGAAGADDFAGIRAYEPGDSPRQLAWRQIARIDVDAGAALVSKHFQGGSASNLILDFDRLPELLDVETRLSRMTQWILEAEARALVYGFRLGQIHVAPGIGPVHQQTCLGALALYGQPSDKQHR